MSKQLSASRASALDAAAIKLAEQKAAGVKLEEQPGKRFYKEMGWLDEAAGEGSKQACPVGDRFYQDQKDDGRFAQVPGKAVFKLSAQGSRWAKAQIAAAQQS